MNPKPSKLCVTVLVAGLLQIAGESAVAEDETAQWPTHHVQEFGVAFQYPPRFVVGKYKPEVVKLDEAVQAKAKERGVKLREQFFQNTVVLVEQPLAEGKDLTALPVGELVAINIDPHTGEEAEFDQVTFNKPEFRVQIGAYPVVKLPGVPAPYGDQGFCYYVFPSKEFTLEFVAPKKYISDDSQETPATETGYDRVIEQIIATLRLIKE